MSETFLGNIDIKEGDLTALGASLLVLGIRRLARSAFVRKFFDGIGKRVAESTSRVKRKLRAGTGRGLLSISKVMERSNPFAVVGGLLYPHRAERGLTDAPKAVIVS